MSKSEYIKRVLPALIVLLLVMGAWMTLCAASLLFQTVWPKSKVEIVNQYGGGISAVTINGDYAYLGIEQRFIVVDVSNPMSPITVYESEFLQGWIDAITIQDQHAYLVAGSNLFIYDISDPTQPVPRPFTSSHRHKFSRDVVVKGKHLFSIDPSRHLVQVYELDDSLLNQVASYKSTAWKDRYNNPRQLFAVDDYIYVVAARRGAGQSLHILDASDPYNLQELSLYDDSDIKHAVVSNDHAFLIVWRDCCRFLEILDLTDKQSPTLVLSHRLSTTPVDMGVEEHRIYLAEEQAGGGVRVFEVDDAAQPRTIVAETFHNIPNQVRAVVPAGNLLYAVEGNLRERSKGRGLIIMDVTDTAVPRLLGEYTTRFFAHDFAISGDNIYVVDGIETVHILSAANPRQLQLLSSISVTNAPRSILLPGNEIALILGARSMQIIDISDPLSPFTLSLYPVSGSFNAIVATTSYVYISEKNAGIHIVEISNPSSPRKAGFYSFPHSVTLTEYSNTHSVMALEHPYLYHVNGSSLRIFDVSVPDAPQEIGFYDVPGRAVDLFLENSRVYIVSNNNTDRGSLHVIDISNPTEPRRVKQFGINSPRLVAASDGILYTSPGYASLRITDSNAPPFLQSDNHFLLDRWINRIIPSGEYIYIANAERGLTILQPRQ